MPKVRKLYKFHKYLLAIHLPGTVHYLTAEQLFGIYWFNLFGALGKYNNNLQIKLNGLSSQFALYNSVH